MVKLHPKSIEANGLFPIWGNKKKFTIICGQCTHGYDDKVVLQSTCSSICPCCHAQNIWSLAAWHKKYEAQLNQELQNGN